MNRTQQVVPGSDDALPREDGDHTNSVLGKTRLILEAFNFDDVDLSLTELVRRTGVPKASVYRLCQELLSWGVIERSGSNYRLGLRLFEIGERVAFQRILREAARPYMEDLFQTTKNTVHLAVRCGLDVLYVEKLVGHTAVRPSRIAGRMPLHCTATGKAILAFSPPYVLDEVVGTGLRRRTVNTITSAARLRREMDKVRAHAVATEIEELRLGYLSVAVPLFGRSGLVVGAMSVTSPTFRGNIERVTPVLRQTGRQVTRDLHNLDVS